MDDAAGVDSSAEDIVLWQPPDEATRVVALLDPYLNFERTDDLSPRLRTLVAEEMEKGATRFILDLARTGVIDSCGLATLVALHRQVEEGGGQLVVCGLSELLLRLLELTGLDRVLALRANVDAALEEASGGADS